MDGEFNYLHVGLSYIVVGDRLTRGGSLKPLIQHSRARPWLPGFGLPPRVKWAQLLDILGSQCGPNDFPSNALGFSPNGWVLTHVWGVDVLKQAVLGCFGGFWTIAHSILGLWS